MWGSPPRRKQCTGSPKVWCKVSHLASDCARCIAFCEAGLISELQHNGSCRTLGHAGVCMQHWVTSNSGADCSKRAATSGFVKHMHGGCAECMLQQLPCPAEAGMITC